MSATNIASFPDVSKDMGNGIISTFKEQLSAAHQELRNAYIEEPHGIQNLVREWSKGEVFIASSICDEIAIETFVGDVLTQNTTNRANCAIAATLCNLRNGEKKIVAKRIASYARLARECASVAISRAKAQAYEAMGSQEMEFFHEIENSKFDLAVQAGAPLGAIPAKKGAQVVLCGNEFLGNKPKKLTKKTHKKVSTANTKFSQQCLWEVDNG